MVRLHPLPLHSFAALGLATGTLFARNGSITGRLPDVSTAAVPNAAMTATLESTGFKTTVSSTSAGLYSFAALPTAIYTMKVSAQGFQEMVRKNVILNIAATLPLNFKPSVVGATTSVEVPDVALAPCRDKQLPDLDGDRRQSAHYSS